jgi:hypothetical protein
MVREHVTGSSEIIERVKVCVDPATSAVAHYGREMERSDRGTTFHQEGGKPMVECSLMGCWTRRNNGKKYFVIFIKAHYISSSNQLLAHYEPF